VLILTPTPLETAAERAFFAELASWDTGGSVRSAVVASLPVVEGPRQRRQADAVLFVPEGLAVIRVVEVRQAGVVTAVQDGAWTIGPGAGPGEVLQLAGGGSTPLEGLMRAGLDAAVRLRHAGLESGRIARLTVLTGAVTGILPADGDLGDGDHVALLDPRSLLFGIARASRYAGTDNPRLWTTADVRAGIEALGVAGRSPSVEELNGEGFPYSPYVLRRRDLLEPASLPSARGVAMPERTSAAPGPVPDQRRTSAGPLVDPAAAARVAAAAVEAQAAAEAQAAGPPPAAGAAAPVRVATVDGEAQPAAETQRAAAEAHRAGGTQVAGEPATVAVAPGGTGGAPAPSGAVPGTTTDDSPGGVGVPASAADLAADPTATQSVDPSARPATPPAGGPARAEDAGRRPAQDTVALPTGPAPGDQPADPAPGPAAAGAAAPAAPPAGSAEDTGGLGGLFAEPAGGAPSPVDRFPATRPRDRTPDRRPPAAAPEQPPPAVPAASREPAPAPAAGSWDASPATIVGGWAAAPPPTAGSSAAEPSEPGRRRTGLVVAAVLALTLVLGVAGFLLLRGDPGSDRTTPAAAATGASTGAEDAGPEPGDTAQVDGVSYTLEAEQVDASCVGHAYGAVAGYFEDTDCMRLSRALWTAEDGRGSAVVSVARVEMPTAATARALRALADTDGSGNVSDLLREGVRFAGAPAKLSGAQYASAAEGSTVTIVETSWTDPSAAGSTAALDLLASNGLALPATDGTAGD
jgi:hypothetical protein